MTVILGGREGVAVPCILSGCDWQPSLMPFGLSGDVGKVQTPGRTIEVVSVAPLSVALNASHSPQFAANHSSTKQKLL